MDQITIVGLGPGGPGQVTLAAARALERASEIIVRDAAIPALDPYRASAQIVALPGTAAEIARGMLDRPGQPGGVVLALPGNPRSDLPWLPDFLEEARRRGVAVELFAGVSLAEAVVERVGIDFDRSELQVVEAARLVRAAEAPLEDPFLGVYRVVDPTRPLIVGNLTAPGAALAERALHALYPPEHRLALVRFPLRPDRSATEEVHLDQLSARLGPGELVWGYLPPLDQLRDVESFDTLSYIVARLRAPGGCPWDREQTFQSIKKHLIEETYEAVDALDRESYQKFSEELGDVLLQVVMYAQLGREARLFDLEDVLRSVNEKLVRRHPHVFGEVEARSSAEVLRNWERIKRSEQQEAKEEVVSSFAGVPEAAPALMRADAVQSRAVRYGWVPPVGAPRIAAIEKPDLDPSDRLRRLGEAFFVLVALARRYHLDPEEALRRGTSRFVAAFDQVLRECQQQGISYESLPVEKREQLLRFALKAI